MMTKGAGNGPIDFWRWVVAVTDPTDDELLNWLENGLGETDRCASDPALRRHALPYWRARLHAARAAVEPPPGRFAAYARSLPDGQDAWVEAYVAQHRYAQAALRSLLRRWAGQENGELQSV